MKKFLTILFIIVFSLCAFAEDPNWYRIDNNNYYDPETVTSLDDTYGYVFLLKAYNKGQYEPVNGRKILYTLSHYEINCNTHSYKIGIMDSYDKNDNFVNGDYNKYSNFQPIVEGSAVGFVFQKLCRQ